MLHRLIVALILFAAAAVGAGAGALVLQVAGPADDRRDVRSITGVGSGVDGTQAKEPEKKGVDQVALPPDAPPTTPPPTVSTITANAGAMQAIRGIKGIDTVVLQNLEAVLRMQAPPPPPEAGGGGGAVRAAAALMTMESDAPPEPEKSDDGREELIEFELEGS